MNQNLSKMSTSSLTDVNVEAGAEHTEHVPQYPAPPKLKQELRITIEEIRRSENDPVKVYSQIAKIRDYYYNKKTHQYRREIGILLSDCGYASCSYKMLKALARRGFYPEGVDKVTNPFLWRTTRFVLDNVWNYSDASPEYAKDLARGNILEVTNEILNRYRKKNPDKKSNQYLLLKASLCIMNNIARRPENKHFFQAYNSEKNVFEFKFSNDNFLKVLALTTMAFIVDAKAAQKLTEDNETIYTIVHWMNLAIEKDDFHRLKEGFTAAELAYALDKLAIDGNTEKIIEAKALKSFYRMLCSSEEDQQINAAKCVWTLSFNPEARKSIKAYKELVTALQRMSKEERNKELLQNVNGALWVLFEKGEEIHATVEQQPKHLFISYCWNEKETARRIWQKLREAGYQVWIDIERMSGDILEAMASAVESSSVVILCISEGYKQSQCCRTEAGYTYKRKKGFIPLLMQAPYSPDGWLGALLSTNLYFDFSSESDVAFDDSFRNLLKEINNKGVTLNSGDSIDAPADSGGQFTYPRPPPRKSLSPSNNEVAVSPSDIDPDVEVFGDSLPVAPSSKLDRSPQLHIRNPRTPIQAQPSPTASLSPTPSTSCQSLLAVPRTGGPPVSFSKMKKSDVRDWMKENDLENSIRNLKHVDGKLLWQLKCMKTEAPQFFYQFLQKELELAPLPLLKFTQALEELN